MKKFVKKKFKHSGMIKVDLTNRKKKPSVLEVFWNMDYLSVGYYIQCVHGAGRSKQYRWLWITGIERDLDSEPILLSCKLMPKDFEFNGVINMAV